MSHIVDFFNSRFGAGGGFVTFIIFAAFAVLGGIIAFRGRKAMVWLVSFCALFVGVLAGAMVGLLVFDSFIIMLVMAFLGGAALLLLVKYVKGIGYFIGISTLSFFGIYSYIRDIYNRYKGNRKHTASARSYNRYCGRYSVAYKFKICGINSDLGCRRHNKCDKYSGYIRLLFFGLEDVASRIIGGSYRNAYADKEI